MSTYDVTITWMDGEEKKYRAGRAFVQEGVLRIEPVGTNYPTVTQYIPLTSIREFVVTEH